MNSIIVAQSDFSSRRDSIFSGQIEYCRQNTDMQELRRRSVRCIPSKLDSSVNWVISPFGRGSLECRYVRRTDKKLSVYVSGHSGCPMGCEFCHLTAQGQTSFKHATIDNYDLQARIVLNHYHKELLRGVSAAERVNINFMARGEPLLNKHVVRNYSGLYKRLTGTCRQYGLDQVRLNISTIMPKMLEKWELAEIFRYDPAHVYYSIYSLDPVFRKKWIPGAMDPLLALIKLKQYQEHTTTISDNPLPLTFHFCSIKDANDDLVKVQEMADVIKEMGFRNTRFSLVAYNPPTGNDELATSFATEESPNGQKIFEIMRDAMTDKARCRMIEPVGRDAFISCGQFPRDDV